VNIYDKLRIHELVLKSMDNEISPAEFAELNQYLSGSSECQQYYNEVIDMYLGVHERLEILASAQTTEPVLEEGLWQSLAESEKMPTPLFPPRLSLRRKPRNKIGWREYDREAIKFRFTPLLFPSRRWY
jgi:anti-sigma factor RsiW